MTINEGLKHKGFPYWIPGAKRSDLPKFLKEHGFNKGVEIGVSWGQNIVDYCKAGLEIYGVDPWKNTRDNIYRKIVSIPGERAQTIQDVYNYAIERTRNYPNCKLIRKLSIEAVDDFPKRSLDFIYIDGNHGFGYVAMDLQQWSHRVRKGGIIAGHDYYSTTGIRGIRHVHYIVNAFAKSHDFVNFWVLGSKKDYVDRELSYMFIKHW